MPVENESGSKEKVVKQERPVEIGKVSVQSLFSNDRTRILKELADADPDHFYSYADPRLSKDELEAVGKEVVVDKKGRVVRHQEDPVVRQPIGPVMERRRLEEEVSYQALKDVTDSERDPRVFAQPKKPQQR